MSTILCNSTTTNPTHDISLTDGSSTVGFVLRNSARKRDVCAITRRPRQQGQYSPFTQSDWSGGRGIKDAAQDRSRFGDGKRVITRHSGTVMLGGQETFTTGYRQAEANMPGSVTWQSLLTTNRYIAYKVTASATGNRSAIYLWVRRRGTPTSTLTVELCADSAGSPSTVLKTVTATTTSITDTISVLYEFAFSSVQAVTATTVYWVKVYTSTADTTTNYWQVGTDAAGTANLTKISSDNGSTDDWTDTTYDLYFRLVDDTDLLGGIFFTYKGAQYFLTRPSGAAAPKLYINGYRGVATGAGQSVTVLQDTTQTFTVDALIGAVVYFPTGTNSEFQTPYRTITDNDANTITFSALPKAPVAADTTYVILGTNIWTEITGHGLTVLPTSVASSGDICYFAQGDGTTMRRMREYLSNTTWTREFAEEVNYAKFITDYHHPTSGLMVAKVNDSDNAGRPSFSQAKVEGWASRLKFPKLLDDGEATTGWTFGTNVTGTADNTDFATKKASIKMVKATGSSGTNPFAYKAWTVNTLNLYKERALRFWIKASGAMYDGEL